jgi:2-oxoglutarate dehydrogenase E2 component (dihydrolipoamide succinyltransferase)
MPHFQSKNSGIQTLIALDNMSMEVKIPVVGESITEVTLANIIKKDGEFVNLDEVICELESDKATFELNSPAAGILHWKAVQGDAIPVGAVVCEIDNSKEALPPKPEEGKQTPDATSTGNAAAGNIIDIKVPVVGESIAEVTIAIWHKKSGDLVNAGEMLCEIESDKATFELEAEASGYLEILVEKSNTVAIGTVIARIAVSAGTEKSAPASPEKTLSSAAPKTADTASAAAVTPLAARILAEKGINPASVSGSGEGGKVTKEDALRAGKMPDTAPSAAPSGTVPPATENANRRVRREKLSSLRKTVARRLVAVKNETAMLTTFNEVDMKPIMDLRNKYKDKFKEKHEVGLGFMSFFTKAVCVALAEFPAVNAMIDGEEIVYNDFADVSIAVSAPKGLVVPVIRNAEKMSFAEIEKEIVRLAGKARDNKLSIDEMTGGTFTITNGGIFGSMMSTPIINAPQSAILGMHNIVERPMVVNGEIVIRPIMYVALSYDHRIIDGRESVGFLVRVKQLLEDPLRLLLDV